MLQYGRASRLHNSCKAWKTEECALKWPFDWWFFPVDPASYQNWYFRIDHHAHSHICQTLLCYKFQSDLNTIILAFLIIDLLFLTYVWIAAQRSILLEAAYNLVCLFWRSENWSRPSVLRLFQEESSYNILFAVDTWFFSYWPLFNWVNAVSLHSSILFVKKYLHFITMSISRFTQMQ